MSDNILTTQTVLGKYNRLLLEAKMAQGMVGKKNPIKKALDKKIKDIETTIDKLKKYEGHDNRSIEDIINDAGKDAFDPPAINPLQLEAVTQKEQEILQKYDDEADNIERLIETSRERYNDYKEQRASSNKQNLGKQVLVRGLVGAGHLAKTLGTAYFMAMLNAGRPEAGMGAEATMNRNNEQIFGSLGQLSTFNLGIGMMPMDMMGGGMIPPPQMGGMMPFNPLGMGGQEKTYDPMADILNIVAAALNNTPPISFGGFEPNHLQRHNIKSPSLRVGKLNIKFPDQEAKEKFINAYHEIFKSLKNSLNEKKFPKEDIYYTAEQNLKKLLEEAIEYTNDEMTPSSKKDIIYQAKKDIEQHISKNLPDTLKPFYDIGIKTDENYNHFINNIDALRINAYADILKSINDNNIDFPNVQYTSLKKAIEDNVDDTIKSGIISRDVNGKLGKLLKKQDYELLDNLFTHNNENHDVTSYANKLQECAKKTQTETIKNSMQDENIPIKLETNTTEPAKKTISFTAQETADWVNNLFPKQTLDNGFAFYGQNIEQITDSTNQTQYKGTFAFAVADKDHVTEPTLYSIKLDKNAALPKDIYDFIDKFLNDETGKAYDTEKEIKISKADILKFKDMCLKLDFLAGLDDTQSLAKTPMGTPEEGKKISDFLKEKAREEALARRGMT